MDTADFPTFSLTDDKRDEIARLSGIPRSADDAFKMIESLIAIYQSRKKKQRIAATPAEIREELKAIGDDAEKLWQRLSRLHESLPPVSVSFDPQMAVLFDLQALCDLMARENDLLPAKPGTNAWDVRILVSHLDDIRREFAGKLGDRGASSRRDKNWAARPPINIKSRSKNPAILTT
jgi:hypothetical protein